jgi:hypothetical protein
LPRLHILVLVARADARAEAILFPKGKTKFIRPDGSIGTAPGHGVVLIGMGEVACTALAASGLGMLWDRRSDYRPDYNANDDFGKSINACYAEVRERMAQGGPSWEPK